MSLGLMLFESAVVILLHNCLKYSTLISYYGLFLFVSFKLRLSPVRKVFVARP